MTEGLLLVPSPVAVAVSPARSPPRPVPPRLGARGPRPRSTPRRRHQLLRRQAWPLLCWRASRSLPHASGLPLAAHRRSADFPRSAPGSGPSSGTSPPSSPPAVTPSFWAAGRGRAIIAVSSTSAVSPLSFAIAFVFPLSLHVVDAVTIVITARFCSTAKGSQAHQRARAPSGQPPGGRRVVCRTAAGPCRQAGLRPRWIPGGHTVDGRLSLSM